MRAAPWVVIGLVAAAAGGFWWTRGGDAPPPSWRTQPVKRGDVVEAVSTTGTVQALKTVTVGTQVSGIVRELLVDFDSKVTKGMVIARLETDVLEARLAQDEASLQAAEASVERAGVTVEEAKAKERRVARLVEQNLAKAEDLETASFAVRGAQASLRAEQTRVAQAKATVSMARTSLAHATITSPIDGVVLSRAVDVGQTVAASLQAPTLFTIAEDLRQMRVEASVDEADIGRVHTGQAVTFTVDAFPGKRFAGRVTQRRLGPIVTNNVVTYQVIVDTANPDLTLLPGMTASVNVEVERADAVLVVPAAALRFQPPAAPAPPGEAGGKASTAQAARPDGEKAGGEKAGGEKAEGDRPRGPRGGGERGGERREGKRTDRVWVLEGEALRPVEVKVGPSDGANVAVEPLEGQTLAEGALVVTGLDGAPGGQPNAPVNPMRLLRGGGRR